MSLTEIRDDSVVKVVSLNGGPRFKEKLVCQGIIPGALLEVISGGRKHSPYVLKINDSKIVIGYGMAARILVEAV